MADAVDQRAAERVGVDDAQSAAYVDGREPQFVALAEGWVCERARGAAKAPPFAPKA